MTRRAFLALLLVLSLAACSLRNGGGLMGNTRSCGGTFSITEPGKPAAIVRNHC